MMYTVRKVRNLSKQKNVYRNINESLMFLTVTLLKQGMIIIQNLINSLKKNNNIFNEQYFLQFTKTKEYEKLQFYLNEDFKVFDAFW